MCVCVYVRACVRACVRVCVCVLPGLLHFARDPQALVISDVAQGAVDEREVGIAHLQEVGSHAAHRHLGDVRERLADGAAEDEHAHLLVEGGDVRVPDEGLGALIQVVDPVALANDDLGKRTHTHVGGRGLLVARGVLTPTCSEMTMCLSRKGPFKTSRHTLTQFHRTLALSSD